MCKQRIKVMIRQADPYDKTGDATEGVGIAKFVFTKTFRKNHLFSLVRVLYNQFSITNHSERNLKSKLMYAHFNDYFCCCFFSF